ncbi:GNAT family N-acetyltransferase [Candidatus Micrarchaeota archaeon]|nr:GNAT family N-acetyltransferase [Candidatus Micrarchaeota archaeon]
MTIEIIVRECRPEDRIHLADVFRDSYDSLRKSRGGMHPDELVDRVISRADEEILSDLEYGGVVLVAEEKPGGEIAGVASITDRWINSLVGSSYSRSLYVRSAYQRGRCGVNVGSILRSAILDKARRRGFRKVFGYSTPEAIGFHTRFGARFQPFFNHRDKGSFSFHFYEIELKPHPLNLIPIEPFIVSFTRFYSGLMRIMRGRGAEAAAGPAGSGRAEPGGRP